MGRGLYYLVAAIAGLLVFASLLPLLPVNLGYVQLFDFPRLQIAAALLLLLVASMLLGGTRRQWLALDAVLVVGLVLQGVQLLPYAPLWDTTVPSRPSCAPGDELAVMVANVEMENRDVGKLRATVQEHLPDVLLVMETNAWWDRQLDEMARGLDHRIEHVGDEHFGIHLLSRLPLVEPTIRFVSGADTPAVYTGLRHPSGVVVAFRGIHPRPPELDQSTATRDEEILTAAASLEGGGAAMLAGDFNAVPWEPVMERAKRLGSVGDPRIGRGFLPTYRLVGGLVAWPIDHVLPTSGLELVRFEVLPDIGSDHRPLLARLCLNGGDR